MKEVDGWLELEESSTITKFKYEASTQTLAVEFKSGGLYHYFDVPEEVAISFKDAESKGKFLSKSIKPTFRSTKMVHVKDAVITYQGKVLTGINELTIPADMYDQRPKCGYCNVGVHPKDLLTLMGGNIVVHANCHAENAGDSGDW